MGSVDVLLRGCEHLTVHGAVNNMYRRAWAARPVIDEAGNAVFRYSLLSRLLMPIAGVLFLAGAICLTYLFVNSMMRRGVAQPAVVIIMGSVCVFLAWIGLVATLQIPIVRVEIRPDGLWSRSPWRRARMIAWDDIRSVSFATVGKYFLIKAEDGRKIRVDLGLPGVPFLYAVLRRKVPNEYWKSTYPLFESAIGT